MITRLQSFLELTDYFTTELFENGIGVVIDSAMENSDYLAINVDNYYHHLGLKHIPCIIDLIIIGKETSHDNFHIFLVEMKKIKRSKSFNVYNIYQKFKTAIDDFMKTKYSDPFLKPQYKIIRCKLFFISDVYHLSKKGFSAEEIDSFLNDTKISVLQSLEPFEYRNFLLLIEYKIPNPSITW